MKICVAIAAAAMLTGATPAPAPAPTPAATVDDLAWMAGQWSRDEGERWTEESWTAPRGGMMLGHSRSGQGGALRAFEFLRIAADADGTPAYIAQPDGGAAVPFRLVRRAGTSATFENAAHDYPQRIHYARDGDAMTATISAIDGSKPMRWTFRRH